TPIWNDVKGGIIQNLSPGMWIYKKVDTTPKGQERREFTATDWEPFEISLVSVPADAETNFMSAAPPPAQPSDVEMQRASAHTKEKPDMETTTQDAGIEARQNEVSLAGARDEAVKAERLRASTIRAIATGPFKVDESFLAALVDEGVVIPADDGELLHVKARVLELFQCLLCQGVACINRYDCIFFRHTFFLLRFAFRRSFARGLAANRSSPCGAPEQDLAGGNR
ncbi:MAG: hypothetical protein HY269_07300, partial [Deltaproteobacteria bacterium]|nr:hypothetical protein [Deltaproteobacteria bacterium]